MRCIPLVVTCSIQCGSSSSARSNASSSCQPVVAMDEALVLDDLAQRRHGLGEHCGVVDAHGPHRRVQERRLVGIEGGGQTFAHTGRGLGRRHSLDDQTGFGQSHADQIAVGHAQPAQRARCQQQRPERVDHLRRNAPLAQQFVVEFGQYDADRRTVGELLVLLVQTQLGDGVQIRGHREQVMGDLVGANAVREHPTSQDGRQPHPPIVGQLPYRENHFVEDVARHGLWVHPFGPDPGDDVVLVQRAVFGQDPRYRRRWIERLSHGGDPTPVDLVPALEFLGAFVVPRDPSRARADFGKLVPATELLNSRDFVIDCRDCGPDRASSLNQTHDLEVGDGRDHRR
jgi:hypothetical protein